MLACVQATTSQGAASPGTAEAAAAEAATAEATAVELATVEAAAELGSDLYALVLYVHKNCNSDLFEAVGALELTLTQIKLLQQLEATERELTVKEGAELVHVSLPAASRMVDELVRRAFVERREDAEDRRMKRIRLTDEGRAVIRRLNGARLSGLQQFAETLNQAERQKLSTALTVLLQRADIAACRPEEQIR
jgi:DNA-binding MarR family transcriptional regulator